MEGYKFIAHTLKSYGVTHVFYVESMLENMLLEASKIGVKPVMTHTENAAGYMADGYARASKRPGICMAQSIGTANLAGGIYDACLANSPVIAMTGKKPPMFQYTGAYQEAEHRLIFEGITKFNAEVSQPNQLAHVLRLAFKKAATGRPGPVHIDVLNNLGVDIEFSMISDEEVLVDCCIKYPLLRPSVDPDCISGAAALIAKAAKPLIVAGRAVLISGAGKELLQLAQKTNIPIVTTPDGKTAINENEPLWGGVIGGYGNACANKIASKADLVIFAGTQASDQTTCNWSMPAKNTQIIQIEIEPAEIGKNYKNTLGLAGDVKIVLDQLNEAVEVCNRQAWIQEVQEYVNQETKERETLIQSDSVPISPYRLCRELSEVLPDDAVLVADTGNSAIWTSSQVRMKNTQEYYRAAGSLGWSYPASLGIKCARPDQPVLCFLGDGAFYYHMSEMETAVRNGINTVTVINNNGGLVQVRELLDIVYQNDSEYSKERAYRFGNVNFSRIAEEMGCLAMRVERPEEIQPAICKALESGRPSMVEVMTNDLYTANPMPEGPRPLYGAASART